MTDKILTSAKPIWQETEMGKVSLRCQEIIEMFGGKADANKEGLELIAYFCYALNVTPHIGLSAGATQEEEVKSDDK